MATSGIQEGWRELGDVDTLKVRAVQPIDLDGKPLALIWKDGTFSALAGRCVHAGGPLGEGQLKDDYLLCPWHGWHFHWRTGEGRPGYDIAVPRYETKVDGGRLWVRTAPSTEAKRRAAAHPLTRPIERASGPPRVVGISTTVMNRNRPRYSTSEDLLQVSLDHAASLGSETKLIKLNDLKFRACEGYYSKSAYACTWPCTITQQDSTDELDRVYEALIHWADVVIIASPIRWGSASSLYFKMIERMNCVQNQLTTHDRVLIRNKVAAFIITGGQDNVQAVAGQMMMFFGELGFLFPQFPFIAHSRGWSAEDMENNVAYVRETEHLRNGARELASRSLDMAREILGGRAAPATAERGGRKAGHPESA
jgi:nitrite reductase/ring-hydroxylating ferredoxin subunit/multimeric flavodoxin WrbA